MTAADKGRTSTHLSRRSLLLAGTVAATVVALGVQAVRTSRSPQPHDPLNWEPVPAPAQTTEPVEVVYCAGWDPATRSPVSPMSESVARARDAAGDQYAAVLFVGGVARAVVEVCWLAHHAEVWHIDASGRRYRGVAYRRWPDGWLRLFEVRGWRYGEQDTPEFAGENPTFRARVHRTATATVERVAVSAELSNGGKLDTSRDWQNWPEPTRPPGDVAVPAADGWPALAGMIGPVTVRPGPDAVPAAFPWHPPHPLRPRHIEKVVTDGARFRTQNGRVQIIKRIPAGTIRLPSGKLLVADPGWLHTDPKPLTATAPPGEYPVDVFELAEDGKSAWTVACRVTVKDAPVTSWDLALLDGEHELSLGDGEFFGNPVDTATLALVDQAGVKAYQQADIDAATAGEAVFHRLSDPKTGTDLVIVPGWSDGAYPVWIGRTEDGAIGCFILDFRVPELANAEPA
ncbi:DUF4241 domain-containing protein [Lentzea sp. NPDC054927]